MDHLDDKFLVEKLRLIAEAEDSTTLKILLNLAANRIEELENKLNDNTQRTKECRIAD